MRLNSRGSGLINIVISLAILSALLYFLLKPKPPVSAVMQERLQSSGVQPGVQPIDVSSEQSATKAVNAQLQKAAAERESATECSLNGGENCPAAPNSQ